jgi:hypothetical protein
MTLSRHAFDIGWGFLRASIYRVNANIFPIGIVSSEVRAGVVVARLPCGCVVLRVQIEVSSYNEFKYSVFVVM